MLQAKTQEAKQEDAAVDDSKFDEFMGNDAGALASFGEYDQDDREADAEWDKVDDIMDERRRDRREKLLKEELEKYRAANPKIVEQLAPYKRKLAEITDAEWEAIPEIGDYTIKKQKRMESFVPVPDTLLAKAAAEKVNMLHRTLGRRSLVTPVTSACRVEAVHFSIAPPQPTSTTWVQLAVAFDLQMPHACTWLTLIQARD